MIALIIGLTVQPCIMIEKYSSKGKKLGVISVVNLVRDLGWS